MRRRFFTLITLAVLMLAAAAPAYAQTPDEAADAVLDYGYYIEPGLNVDESRIAGAVGRAADGGFRLYVVVLDEDPASGATVFASAVLDRVGEGIVLVISETRVGVEVYDPSGGAEEQAGAIHAAVVGAFDAGGDDADAVEAAVGVLVGAAAVTTSTAVADAGSGGSKAGLFVLIAIVGALVLLVVWAVRRQKKSADGSQARAIEEARSEIKKQLDAMANVILEISDLVSASSSREDNQYLEEAGKTYTEAEESFGDATDLGRLEALSDRLDEARWQLDAAAAIAGGQPVPPKPKREERHACFFDPTHRGPFEDAQIETAAGRKTVIVCAADAEKLRRGQEPQPRMIQVGGRGVPAPAAPRSHGGGGFDWLDVFSVVVGGMGQARSYDWGGTSRTSSTRASRSSARTQPTSTRSSFKRARSGGRVTRRRRR